MIFQENDSTALIFVYYSRIISYKQKAKAESNLTEQLKKQMFSFPFNISIPSLITNSSLFNPIQRQKTVNPENNYCFHDMKSIQHFNQNLCFNKIDFCTLCAYSNVFSTGMFIGMKYDVVSTNYWMLEVKILNSNYYHIFVCPVSQGGPQITVIVSTSLKINVTSYIQLRTY